MKIRKRLRITTFILFSLIYMNSGFACIKFVKPLKLSDSSFKNSLFMMVLTKYGPAIETDGNFFTFSKKDRKWCVMMTIDSIPDCDFSTREPVLTGSGKESAVKIGEFDTSKTEPPCLLLFSMKRPQGKPYLKFCDNSEIDKNSGSLGLKIDVIKSGQILGEAISTFPVTIEKDGTYSEIKTRGLSIQSDKNEINLEGNSIKYSGCGNPEVKTFQGNRRTESEIKGKD